MAFRPISPDLSGFFPLQVPPETQDTRVKTPTIPQLKSATPVDLTTALQNKFGYPTLQSLNILNQVGQKDLYDRRNFRGYLAVNATGDPSGTVNHAVFIMVLPGEFPAFNRYQVYLFDPNDYVGRSPEYDFTPYVEQYLRSPQINIPFLHDGRDYHIIRPLLDSRMTKINAVGRGVCSALTVAWSRLIYTAIMKRWGLSERNALSHFRKFVCSDLFDARIFLRAAFGPPDEWIAILTRRKDPPRMKGVFTLFNTILREGTPRPATLRFEEEERMAPPRRKKRKAEESVSEPELDELPSEPSRDEL